MKQLKAEGRRPCLFLNTRELRRHRRVAKHKRSKQESSQPAGLNSKVFRCVCTGNCGLQPCGRRLNMRRHHDDIDHICVQPVNAGVDFCTRCKCDCERCPKQRSKETMRRSTRHAKIFQKRRFRHSLCHRRVQCGRQHGMESRSPHEFPPQRFGSGRQRCILTVRHGIQQTLGWQPK